MPSVVNLEIKARCADPTATRERARRIATSRVGLDRQVDTYFCTPRGRFKLRESTLSGAQLVPYLRADAPGPRRSEYDVIAVADPGRLGALLRSILGVRCVVRKEREIFLYQNVRIHLDRVEGLGSFVELEAVYDGTPASEATQQRKLAFLVEQLGLGEAELVPTSYEALLAAPGPGAPGP